ncbi:DnaB helicase-like protein [Streptomyces puniciscabiei]|uniref:DnaB helicase-like protein n=1 Tax=Streptomyces puniciscabiei TaxID=164348 RepID=A0A542UP35_9ACTN|nr:DnaB helicase-like protein [Streptomyces puniciscabiei]
MFHVEQALLGALLLDPHRLSNVSGIAADSFTTAAHAALYAAISTLPPPDPAEHVKNTKWLDQVLATSRQRARGLTPSYLHTLVQVCPWPRHAPAYARMVEAGHARRRLQTAAERLIQTVDDASHPHPVEKVLAEADALTTVVGDIASRFPPRAGVLPRTAAPPPAITTDHAEARSRRSSCCSRPPPPAPPTSSRGGGPGRSGTGSPLRRSAPRWARRQLSTAW